MKDCAFPELDFETHPKHATVRPFAPPSTISTAPRKDIAGVAELLATIDLSPGISEDEKQQLQQALAAAPTLIRAHADAASLLCRMDRPEDAIALLDQAAATHPGALWPLSIKAALLTAERLAEEALAASRAVVALAPEASVPWMNYAYALKTMGQADEAVAAYRKALELDPANGAAWWGLANLRTVELDAHDVGAMETALRDARDPFQRVQMHFALGKALGDLGDYENSFRRYEEANRLRGSLAPYDAASISGLVSAFGTILTPDFLAQREGQGCDGADAIFIVGMPRSGSTLVEQILASHPLIEGTGELFELPNLVVRRFGECASLASLPEAVARIDANELRALGEDYLRSTQRRRKTERPFFTDKLPSNWRLAPLIRLILPKAKIIDVRRDALACCLSSFATYFNRQTAFPTSLADLSRYYRDYVRLMAHLDVVAPGVVYQVHHSRIVENVESEVRALLDYLALPFEPGCLRFFETQRAIHTPSAQQVRKPLNQDSLAHWRNYEPWADPLLKDLG